MRERERAEFVEAFRSRRREGQARFRWDLSIETSHPGRQLSTGRRRRRRRAAKGKTASVQSVRNLAQLYRDVVTQLQDLAASNSAGARYAGAIVTNEETALDRLDLEAQRDLNLPMGD